MLPYAVNLSLHSCIHCCVTLTLPCHQLQAASNDFVWIYFCSLILLVSFFAVNLVLAVVSSVFSDVSEADRVIAEEQRVSQVCCMSGCLRVHVPVCNVSHSTDLYAHGIAS